MEASAGKVIQNKVRVRSICVRVTATFILIVPLQMSRRHGTLGDLTVAVAVSGKPPFTARCHSTAKRNERQHQYHTTIEQCHKQQQ